MLPRETVENVKSFDNAFPSRYNVQTTIHNPLAMSGKFT